MSIEHAFFNQFIRKLRLRKMLFLIITILMLSESQQASMQDDTKLNLITTSKPMRKKKILPFALLHHLQVIPLHQVHTVHTEVSVSGHQHNTTVQTHSQLIPLLIPVHSVPVHSVPVHSVPVHSVPVHSVPVHSVPVHSVPVHSVPVHSVPVHSVPVHSVPVHSVPVHSVQVHDLHDLSVIPLVQGKSYDDDDPYRNPIGGYGVGWGFGGHGAGHGFHYSYG